MDKISINRFRRYNYNKFYKNLFEVVKDNHKL